MTTISAFDRYMERLTSGGQLSAEDIRELEAVPDILPLGMLADALRRRIHGTRATYLRVASCSFDASFSNAVPPAAREINLTGAPDNLSIARTAVKSAKAVAGNRTVSGFSWGDVERLADDTSTPAPSLKADRVAHVLQELHDAGLDALAELPLDGVNDLPLAIERLMAAGFRRLRLTIQKAPASDRTKLLVVASGLQHQFGCIQSINPLPTAIGAFRPTTGYDDVKMVAVARLAAPSIPSVQVDWLRYGPKLAQVALTFGADDLCGVSGSDDAPEGRRRAPLEEIRRNIEAAGFRPEERDGAFAVIA